MRRAFTLIELLVVIGILSVLLGLVIPAVQKAREAASRTRCTSNIRQLGLALHGYHAARNSFPPGHIGNNGPMPKACWPIFLLPYIEQDALWQQTYAAYQANPHPLASPPHVGFGTHIPLFVCPSDWRVQTTQYLLLDNPTTKIDAPRPVAFLSYLGVEGTDRLHPDGMLFDGSKIRIDYVTDGTSNTLLLAERPPSASLYLGWWYFGIGTDWRGTADCVLGVRELSTGKVWDRGCDAKPNHFKAGRFDGPCDHLHFWSPHPGGANFLFVDGSVRFLRYSADTLLPALATRAGGEVVTIPD